MGQFNQSGKQFTFNGDPAIYVRISLDQGMGELALDRQEKECRDRARRDGVEIPEGRVYSDLSISAADARKTRPAYNRLLADMHAGLVGRVYVWDLDRLTRQPGQLDEWVKLAEGGACHVVEAHGMDIDLSQPGGLLIARIRVAVAENESKHKDELTKDVPTLPRPSYRAAVEWNARHPDRPPHELPAEQPWNPSAVLKMLRNPRYAGFATYIPTEVGKGGDRSAPWHSQRVRDERTGEWVRGQWETIVDVETWERVQRILDDPDRRPKISGKAPACARSGRRPRCRPSCGRCRRRRRSARPTSRRGAAWSTSCATCTSPRPTARRTHAASRAVSRSTPPRRSSFGGKRGSRPRRHDGGSSAPVWGTWRRGRALRSPIHVSKREHHQVERPLLNYVQSFSREVRRAETRFFPRLFLTVSPLL